MAKKFTLKNRYKIDLTNKMELGAIPKQTLYKRFTDGRISGLLAEDLLNALYNNLTKAPSESSPYDLLDDNGNKYESRVVTKRGVNLNPSNQIGSGRSYNEDKHRTKHESLYAYIFIDVRDSPIFYIVGINRNDVPFVKKLSPNSFDKLLKDLKIS